MHVLSSVRRKSSVRTVEESLRRDQFDPPQIGRAAIILGKTRRVARSGIARSIRLLMRSLLRPSEPYHLNTDKFCSSQSSHYPTSVKHRNSQHENEHSRHPS